MKRVFIGIFLMILLILLMLLQMVLWVVTAIRKISCIVFDIIGGIILITAILCLGFGLETKDVVLRMSISGLLIMLAPGILDILEAILYGICKFIHSLFIDLTNE